MDLSGKVALVTGGSGVLGGHICRALAVEGCRIAAVYNENRAAAESLVTALGEVGSEARPFQCDVTSPKAFADLVTDVEDAFGGIDILVNAAAFNYFVPFDDLGSLTHDLWGKILSVNLTGPLIGIKAVVGPMKKRGGGRIVNVSSVAGIAPTGSSIAYAVSKAGLNHLTRCMAVGLAPDILVNCVAPGFLEGTKMTAALAPEYREAVVKGAVLRRPTDKDDVAAQVVAFCRTDSITGQTLAVDAGRVFP